MDKNYSKDNMLTFHEVWRKQPLIVKVKKLNENKEEFIFLEFGFIIHSMQPQH
jgi:hypothetical protein